MQEKTLISFIIPVYNIEPNVLCQCLESILAVQIEGKREIIVVDDGSEQEVSRLLPPQIRGHIHLIRQRNQGAAAARNVGLSMARGEYIQFVDADDHLLPALYSALLSFAIRKKADFLAFRSVSSTREEKRICRIYGPTHGADYMMKNYVRVMPWGYVFRRSVCGDLRFTNGSFYEDEEFTPLLLLRCKRMFYTLSKAYFYNEREGSLTRTKDVDFTQKRFPDFERILLSLHERERHTTGKEQMALKRRVAQIAEDYLYNIMRFTHNALLLQQAMARLSEIGVLPLPSAWKYGLKYEAFRWLIGCSLTRKALTRWVH